MTISNHPTPDKSTPSAVMPPSARSDWYSDWNFLSLPWRDPGTGSPCSRRSTPLLGSAWTPEEGSAAPTVCRGFSGFGRRCGGHNGRYGCAVRPAAPGTVTLKDLGSRNIWEDQSTAIKSTDAIVLQAGLLCTYFPASHYLDPSPEGLRVQVSRGVSAAHVGQL
jgi:hypothetical protein